MPPCPTGLADAPTPGHGLLGTGRSFAQVFGWVLKKFRQEAELMKGFQVICIVTEQVNTENILPMFSTGHGCQGLLPLR